MKELYRLFLGAIALLLTNFSYAGTGSGQVDLITVFAQGGNGEGTLFFRTATNNNKANCSTIDNGKQWAITLEKEYGKSMLALLLSAEAQGKSIFVEGQGDCADWGDRERPRYAYIMSP